MLCLLFLMVPYFSYNFYHTIYLQEKQMQPFSSIAKQVNQDDSAVTGKCNRSQKKHKKQKQPLSSNAEQVN